MAHTHTHSGWWPKHQRQPPHAIDKCESCLPGRAEKVQTCVCIVCVLACSSERKSGSFECVRCDGVQINRRAVASASITHDHYRTGLFRAASRVVGLIVCVRVPCCCFDVVMLFRHEVTNTQRYYTVLNVWRYQTHPHTRRAWVLRAIFIALAHSIAVFIERRATIRRHPLTPLSGTHVCALLCVVCVWWAKIALRLDRDRTRRDLVAKDAKLSVYCSRLCLTLAG